METCDLLSLAVKTAKHLGITEIDTVMIARNMKRRFCVTSIFSNSNYTLWVDKYYIAYCNNETQHLTYVMLDRKHIKEELSEITALLKVETAPKQFDMLVCIRQQMENAWLIMKRSGKKQVVNDFNKLQAI